MLCGEDKKGESLTSTQLINGLWRCPSIVVNASEWGLPCNRWASAISVWKLKRKLGRCASNSLAHEDLGQFEEAHHWNIQAKFYNEKFPLVIYGSDKIGDSLSWRTWCYFEAQVWKRIVTLPLLLFSLNFISFSFLFFFHPESHPDLWGNHSLHQPFLTGTML